MAVAVARRTFYLETLIKKPTMLTNISYVDNLYSPHFMASVSRSDADTEQATKENEGAQSAFIFFSGLFSVC